MAGPSHYALFAAIMGAAVSTPSLAQEQAAPVPSGDSASAPPPAAKPDAQPVDQTIVVTAQRRRQRLEDVPISITSVSPQLVQSLNLNDVAALQVATPSLTATSWVGYGQFYIRAIGANFSNPGVENPVGIYVDGAYIIRGKGGNLEVLDVDNIQVLKGPQGTLWGRNATAGAILINTADPIFKVGARGIVEFGNLGHRTYEGMINVPLSDTVALRVAARRREEGGYIRNLPDNYQFGWSKNTQVRAKLLFQPSPDFSAVAQYERQWRTASQNANYQGLPAVFCQLCSSTPYSYPLRDLFTTAINRIRPSGVGIDADNDFYNLKMKWDLGLISLSSVTAYTDNSTLDLCDCDLTTVASLHFTIPSTNKTFTQSLVATTKRIGLFEATAGIDYLHDRSTYAIEGIVPRGIIKSESVSPFAEISLFPVDKLTVTGGLRYTSDKRSGVQTGLPVARFSDDYLSPRLVFAYDFGRVNAYASYNKGFKAGGINSPQTPLGLYKKEALTAYEAGLKYFSSEPNLRANVAGFYYDYKDLQTVAIDQGGSGGPGAVQQPDARLWGVEFDFSWRPVRALELFGGGLWEHSEFRNNEKAGVQVPIFDALGRPVGMAPGTENLTGFRLPHAPKFSFNIGANVTVPLSDTGWTGHLTGILTYSDSYDFFPGAGGPLRFDRTPSYSTSRMSGSVNSPNDRLEIGFFIENLTNEKNVIFRFTTAPFGATQIINRPRTYGIRLAAKY